MKDRVYRSKTIKLSASNTPTIVDFNDLDLNLLDKKTLLIYSATSSQVSAITAYWKASGTTFDASTFAQATRVDTGGNRKVLVLNDIPFDNLYVKTDSTLTDDVYITFIGGTF